jgi:hypothetical protein
MSGILVDDSDLFDITVRYVEKEGKKIEIVGDDAKGAQSITVTFRRPDYSTSQTIVSASTEYSASGPNLNMMALKNNLFSMLAKSWDLKDDKGQPIPMTPQTIGKLRVEVAKEILLRLVESQGENIV